jgi:hypothetical protein
MTGQLIVTVAGATVLAGGHPTPACWSRCRTRPPAPSSGSTRPPACTTTTPGGSAGSAWPAPSRAQPTAGIGNIYADESLHHARIHPARPAGALTLAEARRLHTTVQAVLRRAIETGGTSIAAYLNDFRGRTDYLDHAEVFRRQGQP